jgi:hypothetical protein
MRWLFGITTLLAALVAVAVTKDSSDVPLKEGAEDVKNVLDDVSEYLAKAKEQDKGGQLKRRIAQMRGDQERFCRGIRQAGSRQLGRRRRGDHLARASAHAFRQTAAGVWGCAKRCFS